jgi:hypothetical protein
MPIIPVLGKLRQDFKFKASPDYPEKGNLSQKKEKRKKKKEL